MPLICQCIICLRTNVLRTGSQSCGQPLSVDGGVAGVGVKDAADSKVRVTRLVVSQEERSNMTFKKSKLTTMSPNFIYLRVTALFSVLALLCLLPIIKGFVRQLPFSGGAQHGKWKEC